jgi:hypothetical protein
MAYPESPTTLLAISGINIPPYSARGITQTLAPIASAASLRRTINGSLVDLSASQFRKYASTISCTDQQHPALNGVWPGLQVTVDCVCELSYLTSGGSADRTVVPSTSRVEGAYTFYRPRLTMRVMAYDIQTDEYGASVGWSLQLEEV